MTLKDTDQYNIGMKPAEWETFKLGDLIEVQNGYAFKSEEFADKGTPIIKIKNIVPPRISFDSTDYYNGIIDKKLSPFVVRKNDILISMTGSHLNQIASAVGKVGKYQFDFPALINQRVGKLYSKDRGFFDDSFLYYFISRPETQIELVSSAGGSANQANISPTQIKNLDIVIPAIKTQQTIASILSSLDDKIEINLQMNKTLEAIAQAIFKEWFVDFHFPGFDGALEDGLPKGWVMRKLNQVANVEIGRTPPRMENQWFSTNNKDVKWISIRDMGNSGIFIFNTSEYLTLAAIEKFRIPVIPPDTVVLSFKLTIGRVGITTERMVSNEAIAQIKSDTLDSGFIYCLLKNYHFDSLGSTSSIATAINSKIIKEMEVLVPEQKVVDEFCRIAGPVFNKIKNNSLEIKTVTEIRDLLLPKLMTGKIKVA